GIRKEKNLPERITRSLIQNEELFIQSLKIFANTSIVGSQGSQSGGSTGGPSGVGNYLRKDGDIMDGVFATRPSIATIADNEIDIRKVTATNYTSKVFLVPESGNADVLNFIVGGTAGTKILGSEFPGQWLIVQPIALATITINNDASDFGDPTATPRQNIRTPDGNPVILKNEQAVLLNFDVTSGQWSFIGAVGTSVTGDICFPEKDSGDQSGALTIFFNRNRFCRIRVIGNLTITFDTSEMIFGKIYFLTVEVLQDPTGQRIVTYTDAPFENNLTPKVFKAANRYTSTRFYAYKLDAGSAVRIFAFDEFQEFSQEFFDGFIQARLDTDQTANLTPNKHIEFDLKIATDNTIVVSVGGGQAAGIFTNFEVGHLYQCECHNAIEGAIVSSELTVQFFNVTKGVFFGSQGRTQLTTHTLLESSQPVAKGFFVADSIGDQIEVRIRAASGVNKIIAGSGSADSTSYVVIKDCGVAGIENLPGNIIPAPTPTGPEVIGPLKGYAIGNVSLSSPSTFFRSLGGQPGPGDQAFNRVPAMGNGKFIKCRTHIFLDTGDNLDLATYVNGVSSGFLGSPLNGVGIHETDLLNRSFVKDDIIALSLGRTGSSGDIAFNTWLELEYNANEFWFYGSKINGAQGVNRFSELVSSGIHTNPSGPEFNNRLAHQRSFGRAGVIQDIVYFGSSPAGTGTTIISIEKNGVVVFDSPDLPVHAGSVIQRFDGIGIAVEADDLFNWKMNGRVGNNMIGIFGVRFILD
ncbi:hypothetical protein LCGC14_1636940, partial [marine sediment metagenome]